MKIKNAARADLWQILLRPRRARELTEGTERLGAGRGRAVIVAVDDVSPERILLDFPHRIHVVRGALGNRHMDDRQNLPGTVMAPRERLDSPGRDPDLAPELPVTAEKEDSVLDDQPVRRDLAEIGVIDGRAELFLWPRFERDDDGRLRRRVEPPEDPDRKQPRLLGPWVRAGIADRILRSEGHRHQVLRRRDSKGPNLIRVENVDNPVELEVKLSSRGVNEMLGLAEMNEILLLIEDLVCALVDRRRREPVFQVERLASLEKDGKLAAFRTEPEAVLTAEGVHMKVVLARGDPT